MAEIQRPTDSEKVETARKKAKHKDKFERLFEVEEGAARVQALISPGGHSGRRREKRQ